MRHRDQRTWFAADRRAANSTIARTIDITPVIRLPRPVGPDRKIIGRFPAWLASVVLLAVACSSTASPAQVSTLEAGFRSPPREARPWVFWYWMQASVSREGITADLEAMQQVGIAGAYLMPIKGPAVPPLLTPPVEQLTPAWWDMVRHAFAEADRLGIELGMHACDGFAVAGGPWITPELSMQKVVWEATQVTGGQAHRSTSFPSRNRSAVSTGTSPCLHFPHSRTRIVRRGLGLPMSQPVYRSWMPNFLSVRTSGGPAFAQ